MNTYTGINIQWPISELILTGKKVIETRTYPIPERLIGQQMIIVETPGKAGKFKQRMIGLIVFGDSFQYKSKTQFYRDTRQHCVTPDSEWCWDETKEKWGWPIKSIKAFKEPIPMKKRGGIVYAKDLTLPPSILFK